MERRRFFGTFLPLRSGSNSADVAAISNAVPDADAVGGGGGGGGGGGSGSGGVDNACEE